MSLIRDTCEPINENPTPLWYKFVGLDGDGVDQGGEER